MTKQNDTTKAEERIERATETIARALELHNLEPSESESDGTKLELGGGSYFVVEIAGEKYTVSVTASYLSDEELNEETLRGKV